MKKNNFAKKIVRGVWVLFFFCVFTAGVIFILIAKGKIGYMPAVEDLENPVDKYASQVLSADMVPLGNYFQDKENRVYINYKDLPPALVQALIATEDALYYDHSGIDA
jgi:penicillin-binding protein 1A